jgi:2-polyprenyl-3-methyl-5-hydroxy-6-metoxy-1,4-benzoquinol methylase
MPVDDAKLKALIAKAIDDIGAGMSAALVVIGDKLGLYKAMAGAGPLLPADLAQRTGTSERYVREWLCNQAAGGYVTYDPAAGTYTLPPEQALALADEQSPVFLPGSFQMIAAMFADEPRITESFRTGAGMDWSEHDRRLFEATERSFRSNYIGNLLTRWIPALVGVEEKLRAGGKVADVGCGHGASTILMAQAFPKSQFAGFDYHEPSIRVARQRATEAGVGDRVSFAVARATDYPGKDYVLVTHFDCLHDMGDVVGAARHVRETLAEDGTWMIVEPFAGEKVEQNLTPVGRMLYAASTMVCVPASLAHHGPALGAQAGEARIREFVTAGGFTRFRRASQSRFNLVFEARP